MTVQVVGNLTWDRLIETPSFPLPNRDYQTLNDATHAGGAGGNVAAGLALLGIPTAIIAAVGRDQRGEDLITDLAAYGVDTSLVQCTDLLTSEFLCVVDPRGDRSFLLNPHEAAFSLRLPKAVVDDGGYAFVGCQLRLAAEILERSSVPRDQTFANIGFWIAGGELGPTDVDLLNRFKCLFLNHDEFEELAGPVRQMLTSANFLDAERQVIITGGAAEAVVLTASGSTALSPAPLPRVENTLGCGDAFMAGYLAAHLLGHEVRRCLEVAHECAGRVAGSRRERWPDQFAGILALQ